MIRNILFASASQSTLKKLDIFNDGSCKALLRFENNALDDSGNYNGTATNMTYADGKFEKSAIFGGSSINARISVPYTFSNPSSVSIWAKVSSTNQSLACLFGYDSLARASFLRLEYNFQAKGAWYHQLPSGIKPCQNLEQWYHLVYTSSGSEPLQLYINGVLQTNLIVSNFNWGYFVIDGLGFYKASDIDNLTGALDQLRIFNKKLTQAEVTALYNEA